MSIAETYQSLKNEFSYFSLYRFPGEEKVHSIANHGLKRIETFDEYWLKDGFIMYPFDRNQTAYFLPKELTEEDQYQPKKTEDTPCDYKSLVERAKQSILHGDFSKVVLARKANQAIGNNQIVSLFDDILQKFPNAFCYLFQFAEDLIWMGASPEVLARFEEENFYTVALAGTQKNALNFSIKEEEEQHIVEEFISSKAKYLGLTEQSRSKDIMSHGALHHIRTEYLYKANQKQALEMVKHLQPSPAVSGFPREQSHRFISSEECLDRSFYSGVVGKMTELNVQLFVNLRCARIQDQKIEFYAGAGITKDSNAELEYQETDLKMDSIRSLLKYD